MCKNKRILSDSEKFCPIPRISSEKPKVAHTQNQDETDEFEDIAHDDSDDEGVDLAQLDSNATASI